MYMQLKNDYDMLDNKYFKLKEESQEALAKLQIYKLQLTDSKKSFNKLQHEHVQTNDTIKEHSDTIRSYNTKV